MNENVEGSQEQQLLGKINELRADDEEAEDARDERIAQALKSEEVIQYVQWFIARVKNGRDELLSRARAHCGGDPEKVDGVSDLICNIVYTEWMNLGDDCDEFFSEGIIGMVAPEVDPFLEELEQVMIAELFPK